MADLITCADFNSPNAQDTNKLVDYYEGNQLSYVIAMLDGKMKGNYGARADWKKRGFVPRTRNITKSIVDKSGLLFNRPPTLLIHSSTADPITNPVFDEIMTRADWLEFFQNVDVYTRLCGSTVVLQQRYTPTPVQTVGGQYKWDKSRGDALMLTLLHQGNCVVRMDITRSYVEQLAYITEAQGYDPKNPNVWWYRLITPTDVIEYCVKGDGSDPIEQTEDSRVPNSDGIVAANFFYDVNKPRSGVWIDPAEDLMSFQEMYNMHITDLEFALAWQKQKAFVTTGKILNKKKRALMPTAPMGHTDAGQVFQDLDSAQESSSLGGLGATIHLSTDDKGQPPVADWKGPESDLDKADAVMRELMRDIAYDWDVNLRAEGSGGASSGFQLIVEEMNNLTLREKRAQSAQAGLRRFYDITRQLYPELPEGILQAEFAAPALPVNVAEQEQVWDDKISGNRASIKDYFMEVKGMTEEQSLEKMEEILVLNKKMNVGAGLVPMMNPQKLSGPKTDEQPNG